jgi:hypothetical protein
VRRVIVQIQRVFLFAHITNKDSQSFLVEASLKSVVKLLSLIAVKLGHSLVLERQFLLPQYIDLHLFFISFVIGAVSRCTLFIFLILYVYHHDVL